MRLTSFLLAPWLALTCALVPGTVLAQGEFTSSDFQTSDGVRLHYLEAGSGPLLVFVPGWTMPADIWGGHQLRHFAATHHVVALDPRGHGRSEKPTYGYHTSRWVRDIAELLEHLGGEPAVVAGWSSSMVEVLVLTYEHGTDGSRAVILVDHSIYTTTPHDSPRGSSAYKRSARNGPGGSSR